MKPLFDWTTGEPTEDLANRGETVRLLLVVVLMVGLAFAWSASIVAIPTAPVFGFLLLFGSSMGLAAFVATFGAAA